MSIKLDLYYNEIVKLAMLGVLSRRRDPIPIIFAVCGIGTVAVSPGGAFQSSYGKKDGELNLAGVV